MKQTVACLAVVCAILLGGVIRSHSLVSAAAAQEDWKSEFDDICSKTQDSPSLTKPEIKGLIERCDRLKPRIEKLDESAAKVYLKRLRMCRELFVFMLETSSP